VACRLYAQAIEDPGETCRRYYRVSTERQRRSRLGIEAQQAAVARFAEAEGFD